MEAGGKAGGVKSRLCDQGWGVVWAVKREHVGEVRDSSKINTCPLALIWNNSDRPFQFELPLRLVGVSAAATRQGNFSWCPVLLPSHRRRGCSQDDSPLNPLYANLRVSEAVFRNPCLKPGLGNHIGASEPLIQREIDPCTGDVLHSSPLSISPIDSCCLCFCLSAAPWLP